MDHDYLQRASTTLLKFLLFKVFCTYFCLLKQFVVGYFIGCAVVFSSSVILASVLDIFSDMAAVGCTNPANPDDGRCGGQWTDALHTLYLQGDAPLPARRLVASHPGQQHHQGLLLSQILYICSLQIAPTYHYFNFVIIFCNMFIHQLKINVFSWY